MERRKTMGFKNDSVYRTRRILCLVIFVLLLSIIVVCISIACRGTCANHGDSHGPASAKPSAPQPAVTDTPALQTEPAQTDNPPATQAAETPAPSDGIPLVVTEGDMNAVMARLEQLKTLPSDKTIILLDVGHGGFDPGSIGLDTGVREDELNLQVARFVAQKLGEKGYYVFMTRMGSYAVADTKNEDMRLRKEFMKLDIFDAVISIHMNSYPDDRSVDGTRLFYYKEGTKGQTLATIILDEICKATGQRNRGTNSGDLMVVREPVAPSALVECGFISNGVCSQIQIIRKSLLRRSQTVLKSSLTPTIEPCSADIAEMIKNHEKSAQKKLCGFLIKSRL